MGRIGPPGRRGTRRDVGPNVNDLGASAAPQVRFGPSGEPLRPTEGRGLWLPRPRCGPLVVIHTTAPPTPSERARDHSEMADYHRDLVLDAVSYPNT